MKNKNRCIMRRALSVMLALLMLLTVMPLTVFAEETETETFKTGDIIGFGSYPQSEVTDEALKNALTAAAGSTDGWTSYNYYIESEQSDYMKYTDVEYNGEKYRGVYFTQYRPYYTGNSSSTDYSYQDDNGYSTSTIYWFKYEPMKWQVLSYDSTTGEAVVLSKSIIDSQQYYYTYYGTRTINGATVYPNNYEHSDIRTWLNGTFYNTAFGTSEKNVIVATMLDNSAYSTSYSKYNSNSTTDNVWLLSYSEALNTEYGFTATANSDTETRQATGTAYALCQGLYKNVSNGCSYWRLRSAGGGSSSACYVDDDGWVCSYYVSGTSDGVRPALTLNLTFGIDPTEPTTEPITEPTTVPTTEPTTEPSEETTTKPSEESTTKSSEESTTKLGEEPTTNPSEEPTTKPGEESTTKSGEESTTKPSEESTTKSSEESTTKSSEESTTKSSEESTTKPSEETTTKSGEESTTKPTTEPTTKPAAEDSDGSTTKGECSHICHKSGIAKFFYKILRFFWKLFKINKVCDCGFEHY